MMTLLWYTNTDWASTIVAPGICTGAQNYKAMPASISLLKSTKNKSDGHLWTTNNNVLNTYAALFRAESYHPGWVLDVLTSVMLGRGLTTVVRHVSFNHHSCRLTWVLGSQKCRGVSTVSPSDRKWNTLMPWLSGTQVLHNQLEWTRLYQN